MFHRNTSYTSDLCEKKTGHKPVGFHGADNGIRVFEPLANTGLQPVKFLPTHTSLFPHSLENAMYTISFRFAATRESKLYSGIICDSYCVIYCIDQTDFVRCSAACMYKIRSVVYACADDRQAQSYIDSRNCVPFFLFSVINKAFYLNRNMSPLGSILPLHV